MKPNVRATRAFAALSGFVVLTAATFAGPVAFAAELRRRWAEHLSGDRNRAYALWNVLMFQSWLETQGP